MLQIHITQAAVEEDFTGIELELEAQLLIVDIGVSSKVKEGVVEIGQGFFEVTDQEI